jgi:glutathione S-transferase
VLETDGGEFLSDSNAILFYLAEGSPLLPEGRHRTGARLAVDVLRAVQT